MRKTREDFISKLAERIKKLYNDIKNSDWSNPRVILIAIACVIFPFVAWHYISTGMVLGLMMSISILWLLEKSPKMIQQLVMEYPLLADVILSTLVVMSIGGYFGAGLTLGLGAVFSTVILSWALPIFAARYKKENEADPI